MKGKGLQNCLVRYTMFVIAGAERGEAEAQVRRVSPSRLTSLNRARDLNAGGALTWRSSKVHCAIFTPNE